LARHDGIEAEVSASGFGQAVMSLQRLPTRLLYPADEENWAMTTANIIGVYNVRSPEPCHLIELELAGVSESIDPIEVTQEIPDQPRSNWQVSWDEQYLATDGTQLADPKKPWSQPREPNLRLAFFFHYLDFRRPLLTPFGELELPKPKRKPRRLSFLRYQPPD
jgi:hypothetical protein